MQFARRKITGLGNLEGAQTSLAERLGMKFQPLIAASRAKLAQFLGEAATEGGAARGDVLFAPGGEMFYYDFLPQERALIVGGAWEDSKGTQAWEDYLREVEGAVQGLAGKELPILSPYFRLLSEESRPLQMGEWERKVAAALRQPGLRSTLQIIAQKGTVSLPEAAQGRSLFEVGEEVQALAEMGLICCEFEVFCKETGQKVSRVASMAALDEAAKRGFRCVHCGHPISQEQIVQILSITESGLTLSQPNMWLVYIVGAALSDCGVSGEHILYRSENEGRYCEVFADYHGSLLMFSIAESGLCANSVFRIITRSRFFHPDYTFAVTPVAANMEAQRVIKSEQARMQIVDNLDELADSIRSVSRQADRALVSRLLEDLNGITALEIGESVGRYFFGPRPQAASEPEVSAEEPLESAAIAQPLPLEEETPAAAAEEPILEESQPQVASEPVAIQEEPLEEIQPAALESTATFEEELQEITAPTEAQEVAPTPEPVEEEVVEPFWSVYSEDLLQDIAQLRDQLEQGGDPDLLEEKINAISELGEASAMIVAEDGMAFLGALETCPDPDSAAAFLPELSAALTPAVEEQNLGSLHRVWMGYPEGSFDVYPAADGLNLMIHAPQVGSLEYGGHASAEDTLDKALLGLTVLDSFFDAIIVQEEAIIGSTTQECDALALATQGMAQAVGSYLGELGLEGWKALLFEVDGQLLALYPLPEEAVLVCILDKTAHESVWRCDIPARLGRVREAMLR